MSNTATNPVLSGRIIPTFLYYVLSSSIGLIALTTANLVDGVFLGNYVGASALASVTLLVPYLTLLFALALMLAIGGAVSAGNYLGQTSITRASSIFTQSIAAILVITLSFTLFSLIFEQALFRALNAPDTLQPLMSEYLSVIRWSLIIQLLTMVLYYFVRTDGHPILATTALVIGALTNVALDMLFIGVMQLGIKGAAYATLLAQTLQFLILCGYFMSPSRHLKILYRTQNWRELIRSSYNGLSEFINEISVGLIFLLLNYLILERAGVEGIAAFTVINYFIFVSIMLCYGIADALHLLVSHNHGANNHSRVRSYLIISLSSTVLLGVLLLALMWQWQDHAMHWFLGDSDRGVINLATGLYSLIWPLFLVNGFNIILSCYLTAIHKPQPSALLSISRSLLLPGCLLLAFFQWVPDDLFTRHSLNQWSFLLALPIAEWGAFVFALFLLKQHWPQSQT